MDTRKISYRIVHVGINNDNGEEAIRAAEKLCFLFNMGMNDETSTHVFAGTLFEVKKNRDKGKYGHVALQTDDIEAAIEDLKGKGVGIIETSIKRDTEGKIRFVYLDLEISGFAFHLVK